MSTSENEKLTSPLTGCAGHEAYLRARLRGLGVPGSGLDDAVQDVFEVLVRRIDAYDRRFSLRQWMAGVARKVARRHRERAARVAESVDEATLPSSALDPERWTAQREAAATLRRFLAGLDEARWAVFVLAEIEGLRGTEIAAELEVPLSTVYARLRSAKQAFEVAVRADRGEARRGWFVLPLFGDGGARPASGMVAPFLLCSVVVGVAAGLGIRCVAAPEPLEEVSQAGRSTAAARAVTAGGGVDPRSHDRAGTRVYDGPRRDEDGWHMGPSGRVTGEARFAYTTRYLLEDDEMRLRVEYTADASRPARVSLELELDGLTVAAGAEQWPLDVPAGGTRSAEIRLVANRPGVVQAQLLTPFGGAGAMGWWFVHEDGRLRHCQGDECKRRPETIAEGLTGSEITVEVRNECARDIEFLMMPGDSDLPPTDAPRHRLAEGARRVLRIDGGLWFRVIKEDGTVGGSAVNVDSEGMRVRFFGERCGAIVGETIAAGPWDRR